MKFIDQEFSGQTVELVASNSYMRCFFDSCKIKRSSGPMPLVLACVFTECEFEPPFVVDDFENSWREIRCNHNQIVNPK